MEMFAITDGQILSIEINQIRPSDSILDSLPIRDRLLFKLDRNTNVFSTNSGEGVLVVRRIIELPITTHFEPLKIDDVDYVVQGWDCFNGIKATKIFKPLDHGMDLFFAQLFINNNGHLTINDAPMVFFKKPHWSELYVAPLKNVYSKTGLICTGPGYESRCDGTIDSFNNLYEHFIETPYNGDLGGIPNNRSLKQAIKWRASDDKCFANVNDLVTQCALIKNSYINIQGDYSC